MTLEQEIINSLKFRGMETFELFALDDIGEVLLSNNNYASIAFAFYLIHLGTQEK